jgi:chromosome segregation ATPase
MLLPTKVRFTVNTLECIREAESVQKEIHNQERENEALKQHNNQLEEARREIMTEHEKVISENTQLRTEIEELKRNQGNIFTLKETIESDKRVMAELNEGLRSREKIIKEYDEKFELLEEQTQNAIGVNSVTQYKASTLDFHIVTLQQKIDELQKQNEEISLEKEREVSSIMQERIENKKITSALEKKVEYLNKEKGELEKRLIIEVPRIKRGIKKFSNTETQTEAISPVQANEDTSIRKRLEQEEDLVRMEKCVATLKCELDKITEKLANANKNIENLYHTLEVNETELRGIKERVEILSKENEALKKKKEAAVMEIKNLNMRLERRRTGGSVETSPINQLKKDNRFVSEAVILCITHKELKLLVKTKEDLQRTYKSFLQCVFTDNGEGKSLVGSRSNKEGSNRGEWDDDRDIIKIK